MTDDLIEKLMSQVGDDVQKVYDHEVLFKAAAARIRELEAEIEALREGRGVKVKPLEWTGPRETDGIHYAYDAECPIGHYIASVTDDGRALAFRVGHGGSMYPDGGSVEDAKAAAQADYERRVLSALSPAPVSVPEAAKLLLGDDFNSPMLTALDPFNNDADVAQDVLAALRALAKRED